VFVTEQKDEATKKKTATKKKDVEIHEDPLLAAAVKPRRKMRRSVSFSEGQKSPQKSPVKSGYNKHLSAKYDAVSAIDKPDAELTMKEMIQVFDFVLNNYFLKMQFSQLPFRSVRKGANHK